MTIEEQFDAMVAAGENVFLTGAGGTGKSTIMRRMIASDLDRFAVTASTGIAALNVGGATIHRWSGMMLGPRDGESDEDCLADLMLDRRPSVRKGFERIRSCQTLVIDEISMLNGRTLDFLDFMCRKLRRSAAPFGGIQIIATGDYLQLPPVNKTGNYDWAFQSRAWKEAALKVVHLTEVKRQDDREFVRALSEFRLGVLGTASAKLLRSRIARFPDANLTRLFCRNTQVDRWNAYRLGEIEAEPTVFEAELTGPESQQQFLEKNLLTPRELVLKPTAHVMFTVNSSEGGYVNGQTGVVADLGSRRVLVESNGRLIQVEPFTWQFDSKDRHSATFTQFPLRLSSAVTIHKAQGITLDSAHIDVRAAREPGQAYVALSRVRTLSGLHLKDWFSGIYVSRAAVDFYLHSKMTVIIDTREPSPHPWEQFLPEGWTFESGTLETGDMALACLPDGVVVERKTASDLAGCIGSSRERFERELKRSRYCGRFIVVCEGSLSDVYSASRGLNQNAIAGTIAAWTTRYCPIVFAGTVAAAADFAFRALRVQVRDIERASQTLFPKTKK